MRMAVLPRDLSASVITGAVSRMGWAFGALTLLSGVPAVIETLSRAGHGDRVALPVLLLLSQLLALALAARRANPWGVASYLLVGAVLCAGYQYTVIETLPGTVPDHLFLLSRPAIALITVGVTARSTLTGVGWLAIGLGVAMVTSGSVAAVTDERFQPGFGPALVFGLGVAAYAGFALIQRHSRARVPNIDELEAETQSLADGENLSRRTTAVVHDTVLNDLAIVMNGPSRLDDRARARLRADLDTLTGAEWLTAAEEVRPPDEQDVHVRNTIASITSDLQWRGLTVQLSGVGEGVNRLQQRLVDAMLDGIRAALENVLRHSGVTVAELAFAYDARTITVMVIDQGSGFDPRAVDADRLGIRNSITRRIEDAGGTVSIWSTPGAGTSVVMSGPIEEIVIPHERSDHRERTDGVDPTQVAGRPGIQGAAGGAR